MRDMNSTPCSRSTVNTYPMKLWFSSRAWSVHPPGPQPRMVVSFIDLGGFDGDDSSPTGRGRGIARCYSMGRKAMRPLFVSQST